MARLLIHADAEEDLRNLVATDSRLAARLLALLQEVEGDPNLLAMLTAQDFGTDQRELFHAGRWQEFWQKGMDLWRLKFWELEHQGIAYRVVYALKRGTGEHHVLAVVHRSFDYDPGHPITRRVLSAYDDL